MILLGESMNYRVVFPKNDKFWRIEQEGGIGPKIVHKAKSVLILKESEAICEMVDNKRECYILVTGVERERHENVTVLKKI
jgi:hypothetical protein